MWTPIPYDELGEAKPDFSFIAHRVTRFKSRALAPWVYCKPCGLVLLKNKASQKAWTLGCNWKDIEKANGIR